ncbi:hypothetical protein F7725_004937 [Dissostichus mawsoni]|uniref:Uncharacterized protein n=1 Tax=Dissostichus mawsoni TaxID=36200 RepID=A0A7J5XKW5_DISMA|nr:hypothetical protein F7725_004937 [Dissostichus mawsoni]
MKQRDMRMNNITPIRCVYVTHIKPRVIGPESGDMKCEASFCEDVFVPLESYCKLWILRHSGFNTFT